MFAFHWMDTPNKLVLGPKSIFTDGSMNNVPMENRSVHLYPILARLPVAGVRPVYPRYSSSWNKTCNISIEQVSGDPFGSILP